MTKKKRLLPDTKGTFASLSMKNKNEPVSKESKLSVDVDEKHQIEFLIHSLETNDLLRQLCQNEIVFVILSSSTV
jgi:hypothetical protein